MFSGIINAINFIWRLLKDNWYVPFVELYEWLRKFFLDSILPFFLARVPQSVKDIFTELDFAAFEALIWDVAWILPVWTILGIYTATYTACGLVRVIRWILAFIPTIGA